MAEEARSAIARSVSAPRRWDRFSPNSGARGALRQMHLRFPGRRPRGGAGRVTPPDSATESHAECMRAQRLVPEEREVGRVDSDHGRCDLRGPLDRVRPRRAAWTGLGASFLQRVLRRQAAPVAPGRFTMQEDPDRRFTGVSKEHISRARMSTHTHAADTPPNTCSRARGAHGRGGKHLGGSAEFLRSFIGGEAARLVSRGPLVSLVENPFLRACCAFPSRSMKAGAAATILAGVIEVPSRSFRGHG